MWLYSDDTAAEPQPHRTYCDDNKAEIAPRIFLRSKTKGRTRCCNQNNQPVEPAKQRNEADNGENKRDKSQEECNDIGHAQTLSTGGGPGKRLSFAGVDPAKHASGRIPPPRWQSAIFGCGGLSASQLNKETLVEIIERASLHSVARQRG